MAKVKTEKTFYKIGEELKDWLRVTKVNPETGEFTIEMPDAVLGATGIREVSGKTLDEVERNCKAALKDYNSMTVEVKKVILYRFDYHSETKEPPHVSHGRGSGLMIEIFASVYEEQKGTAKSGQVKYSYKRLASPLLYNPIYDNFYRGMESKKYEMRLDWTQELEDFFANTQTAMDILIDNLRRMESPVKLIEYAYNNRLLGTGESGETR